MKKILFSRRSFPYKLFLLPHVLHKGRLPNPLHDIFFANLAFFHIAFNKLPLIKWLDLIALYEAAESFVMNNGPAKHAMEKNDDEAAGHYRHKRRCTYHGPAHNSSQRNGNNIIQWCAHAKRATARNTD